MEVFSSGRDWVIYLYLRETRFFNGEISVSLTIHRLPVLVFLFYDFAAFTYSVSSLSLLAVILRIDFCLWHGIIFLQRLKQIQYLFLSSPFRTSLHVSLLDGIWSYYFQIFISFIFFKYSDAFLVRQFYSFCIFLFLFLFFHCKYGSFLNPKFYSYTFAEGFISFY